MKNIVLKIFVGMVMMFSVAACFGTNEGAPSNCSQAEMDWFWKDLEDGYLDYPHECGTKHYAPDPSDNGFNIDAPEVVSLTARKYRYGNLARFCSGENKHDMGRRFLQRL